MLCMLHIISVWLSRIWRLMSFLCFQYTQLLDFTPPLTTILFTLSVDFKTKVYPHFTSNFDWAIFSDPHTSMSVYMHKVTSCDNIYCVLGLKNELGAYKQTKCLILCNCLLLAKNISTPPGCCMLSANNLKIRFLDVFCPHCTASVTEVGQVKG
jgi:hypothetical protein